MTHPYGPKPIDICVSPGTAPGPHRGCDSSHRNYYSEYKKENLIVQGAAPGVLKGLDGGVKAVVAELAC